MFGRRAAAHLLLLHAALDVGLLQLVGESAVVPRLSVGCARKRARSAQCLASSGRCVRWRTRDNVSLHVTRRGVLVVRHHERARSRGLRDATHGGARGGEALQVADGGERREHVEIKESYGFSNSRA